MKMFITKRCKCNILFAEIANKCPVTWSADNCSIPPISVRLARIKHLVENNVQDKYELVIAELSRLYESTGDVIPFKVYARLIVAIKIAV